MVLVERKECYYGANDVLGRLELIEIHMYGSYPGWTPSKYPKNVLWEKNSPLGANG